MRRRAFLAGLCGAAAWPALGRAQGAEKVFRLGYLAPLRNDRLLRALVQGLRKLGYLRGVNLAIDDRFAEGPEELGRIAADLVRSRPDAIVTVGNAASRAARQASHTIPIVFAPTGDALGTGLVQSLARPEANLTGLSINTWVLNQKRLELLKETFPGVARVAVLSNFGNPSGDAQWELSRRAGEALGLVMELQVVRSKDGLDAAFREIERARTEALHVASDAIFDAARDRIIAFSTTRRMPAIYEHRAFAEAGGLMSYGPNLDQVTARAASYVDRIFKGAQPGDLPVEQPTHFELVVNLKAATAMNLALPPTLLIRADEVIE